MKDIPKQVADFFTSYPLKSIDDGQIIVQAGNQPAGVYFIESGEVRQYDISERGDEVVVNVFRAGAYFPMSWAINKEPNQYFFEASTSSNVRIAPPGEVTSFLHKNPEILYDLLRRVFVGTEVLQRRMAHLMAGDANSRTLFELIVQCRRFGQLQPDGSYILPIHEQELARRAGLSRETTNRILTKLKKAGLLGVTHKALSVRNLAEIERELGTKL
ncbi:MAG: Crp/Fnr family transcriptional regulator [Candidatus Saccharimonadaceae bacterium]